MTKPDPLHMCIMGHSGVGKSPLSKLFPVRGWDPFRVRKPRDENDTAMTREDFNELMVKGHVKNKDKRRWKVEEWERGELVFPSVKDDDRNNGEVIRRIYEEQKEKYEAQKERKEEALCVCQGCSFFTVRGKDQCLCHQQFDPDSSMRIEVFPPVLRKMVSDELLRSTCRLKPENMLVILLNPTALSFVEMGEKPSEELRLATVLAVTERCRINGEIPDLADALRRVEYLHDELKAWRDFIGDTSIHCLECLEWEHFEFRYHSNEAAERERARNSLFRAVRDHRTWEPGEKTKGF